MDYVDLLTHVALGTAFFPVTVAISKFKTQIKTLKLLSVFIIFNGVTEIVNYFFVKNWLNSLPIHHIFTVVEFSIALIISWMIFFPLRRKWFQLLAIIIIVLCISILDIAYFESIWTLNSIPRMIQGLSMIALSIAFFYKIFNDVETYQLLRYPYFWLYAGWLIYFSGTFFLFVYSYKTGMTITYPIIHSVLYIFLNLVYTYVLWLGSRKSIS